MKNLKHSRQREALLELLKSVNSHPTAEWLYSELKREYTNLSLATVYRNLNLFCDTGEVIKFDAGDGVEHYDATTKQHCHFICKNCRNVIDIDVPLADKLNSEAEKLNNILVSNNSLMFFGLCSKCK